VKIQFVVFSVMTPGSVVVGYQCFAKPCCLHLQDKLRDPSYFTTDGQSVRSSVRTSWLRAPFGTHNQVFIYCQTITDLVVMELLLWRDDGSVCY